LNTHIRKHGLKLGREKWISIMNQVALAVHDAVYRIRYFPPI
jgi:hypothetical protein